MLFLSVLSLKKKKKYAWEYFRRDGKASQGVLPGLIKSGCQDCFPDKVSLLYFDERGKGKYLQMENAKYTLHSRIALVNAGCRRNAE